MVSTRRLASAGLVSVLALTATGCLQNPADSGGAGGVGGFVDNSQSDGDGKVTILGVFGGAEKEAFVESFADFEEESGIDIEYVDDGDFTTTIKQQVRAGSTPDIGLFPQPGGLIEMAEQGYVQPIDTYLDYEALDASLVPGFLDAAQYNGRTYGAPMRMASKSIVWYPKKAWDAAGYQPPKTLDELQELTEQIKADGIAPWCMTWNADAATGWAGTDWIEQLVVTLHGPEYYNEWVTHQVPFDDEGVVEAFDRMDQLVRAEGQTYGGADNVLSTSVNDAMDPAFAKGGPECMLERQGNFEISFLDPEIQENLDEEVGTFAWPPLNEGEAPPLLGGGDIAALFNGNDDEAIEVMEYLTSPDFGAAWAQAGGYLSPHKEFDPSNYPDEVTKTIAEQAVNASALVYDGSDVMPKEVGSGTFWTEMTEWIQGKSSQETAAAIEESWPE